LSLKYLSRRTYTYIDLNVTHLLRANTYAYYVIKLMKSCKEQASSAFIKLDHFFIKMLLNQALVRNFQLVGVATSQDL